MHRIFEDTHKRCVSCQKKCTVFTVYKKSCSHHHLPAKAGLIFKKPHITHDAVFVTHAVTSESALSKMQVHQGQKGQVASLSPQPPRPLMLSWEPAQVLCWSPGKLRLRTAQKAFGTQLWRVGSSAWLASWAGYPAVRIGVAGGWGRADHRTAGGRKEAKGRARPPRSASC